jgi:hypothetical protein
MKEIERIQERQNNEHVDWTFEERERRLAEYHQMIAERDKQIFERFNSPTYITHSKQEVFKTQHVDDLNKSLIQKD